MSESKVLKFTNRKVVSLPDEDDSYAIRLHDYLDYSDDLVGRRIVASGQAAGLDASKSRFLQEEQFVVSHKEGSKFACTSIGDETNRRFKKADIHYVVVNMGEVMPGDVFALSLFDIMEEYPNLDAEKFEERFATLGYVSKEDLRMLDLSLARLSVAQGVAKKRDDDVSKVFDIIEEKRKMEEQKRSAIPLRKKRRRLPPQPEDETE